ncbi:MAG: type II toxin-antitoxin system HicA family toxin [Oscillospiraceae bacterium]|nr:type II toxin-antitoxin system HicA family toxin [Oscillospiraceae bacterium]
MEEAEKVLAAYGYDFKRQKGSHRHYLNKQGDLITLKDPLKISCIDELLKRIGEK